MQAINVPLPYQILAHFNLKWAPGLFKEGKIELEWVGMMSYHSLTTLLEVEHKVTRYFRLGFGKRDSLAIMVPDDGCNVTACLSPRRDGSTTGQRCRERGSPP